MGKYTLYRACKAALNNFTRNAALEFAGAIRVNSICPGIIRTGIVPEKGESSWANYEKQAVSHIPLRRLGEAWEVAKLAAYLASDKAAFINGAQVLIDGGWVAAHAKA